MRRAIIATGVLLMVRAAVAQVLQAPVADQILPPPATMPSPVVVATPTIVPSPAATPVPVAIPASNPPPLIATPTDVFTQPVAPSTTVIGEPPWCASPYRNSAWRIEFAVIPTTSDVSDFAFGEWKDNGALALRLGLGYEGSDGVGTRLQFWGIGQEAKTLIDDVDLNASTFYWDFCKRLYIQDAELVLGGGLAGSNLEYKLSHFSNKAEYSGGGISLFGEGFYPLWRFKSTDIGSVARGRVALMTGSWDDDGMPFINDTDHDVMTVFELAWGMELRHRFGPNEDKYWYIDLVPEFQAWDSKSLPDAVDPGFQGTSINFGLAW
jgi:hypothetical protein